ncbi:hypothetical protein CRE_09704 [Caenorhabditis remanei]|uniref:F-box associated domain-containing protein n=1 Tax=Caenorhabditis remanei TaxID=31234 RepID=E3MX39_CAERE|nr:hypothetical protein CRE_09704 [Caenorhabditis remanei]
MTTKKLSYPGLRCVLEYLEANRRIHITARSPALRRIEKSIPIHLELLKFRYRIKLNDIQMGEFDDSYIQFVRGEKFYYWEYPINQTGDDAAQKIKEYYLGGRRSIYADHFWFSYIEVRNFPQFNVTTNELTVRHFLLEEILQFINPKSFPLKEMTIEYYDDFNHPHICSAKKLCVEIRDGDKNEYSNRINAIQHKNVELIYDTLEWTDVMGLIRYWMENGKETGTILVFCGRDDDRHDEILTKLRNEFSEILSELTGVDDQYPNGTPGFSIPLTSSSKILVYDRGSDVDEELALKVVSSQADDNTMDV